VVGSRRFFAHVSTLLVIHLACATVLAKAQRNEGSFGTLRFVADRQKAGSTRGRGERRRDGLRLQRKPLAVRTPQVIDGSNKCLVKIRLPGWSQKPRQSALHRPAVLGEPVATGVFGHSSGRGDAGSLDLEADAAAVAGGGVRGGAPVRVGDRRSEEVDRRQDDGRGQHDARSERGDGGRMAGTVKFPRPHLSCKKHLSSGPKLPREAFEFLFFASEGRSVAEPHFDADFHIVLNCARITQ